MWTLKHPDYTGLYNAKSALQAAKKAFREHKQMIVFVIVDTTTGEEFMFRSEDLDYRKKNHRR